MPASSRRPVADRLPVLRLPDQSGRRVVVTGASSGLGEATAGALARAGAEVVLAVRNPGRGAAAADRLRRAGASGHLRVEVVELGSLASVAGAASRIGSKPVDLLINNAGLATTDATAVTAEGFSLPVGVNYLGAWALTAGLWSALEAGRSPRVVMLGSLVARLGRIRDDFGRPGGAERSYSDSKLAAIVLAQELQRRAAAVGSPVTVVAAHPGWAQTAIFDTARPPAVVERVGARLGVLQSAADGAQPILRAATDPAPAGYYGPARRWGAAGPAAPTPVPGRALAPGVGDRLWQLSGALTGVGFDF
ncbi:MAG TPA: SDR family NAD(P)-dependent oxidoreductase [Propionicimonas sp.]|jgi:NAD(P)-dependent dehydrogenase (short-subunit alcohol dehydrogenase family)|nr:SDR family NAD(P)-dependent oxidoreductase [Propionicimonas sp.]